jgi:hypothetical protein
MLRASMPVGDVIPHTLVGLHDGCTWQIALASGLRTLQIAWAERRLRHWRHIETKPAVSGLFFHHPTEQEYADG